MAPQSRLRGRQKATRSRRSVPARPFLPWLEALEDLTLPSLLTVMNLNDSGPGSLRDAVAQANAAPGGDMIQFAAGLTGTITLKSEIQITDQLAILGPGAGNLTISGNDASRVFEIGTATSHPDVVGISSVTIAHGLAAEGAGILNHGSKLMIFDSVFANDHAVGAAGTAGGTGSDGIPKIGNRSTVPQSWAVAKSINRW